MSQVMHIEPVEIDDGHAACGRCGERAWFFYGDLDVGHDCPAAGRPVVIERCDACVDGIVKEHRGGCGHFCGCHQCEQCAGTCYIAHILPGPALPADLEHPYNAPVEPEEREPDADRDHIDPITAGRFDLDALLELQRLK